MKTIILSKCIVVIVGALLLFGCAKKPPECGDSVASDTLHRLMNEQVVEGLRYHGVNAKEDKRGVIAEFLGTWTFGLSNISTIGYVESSRTRTCKAKATVTMPGYSKGGEVEVTYTLQTFEDSKNGQFELKAAKDFVLWANNAATVVLPYYKVNRVYGTWVGTTSCSKTQISFSNAEEIIPQQPDSELGYTVIATASPWENDFQENTYPVSLNIKEGKASMAITKPDGSKVVRSGTLDAGGHVTMENNDELSNLVLNYGDISGEKFVATVPDYIRVEARVKSNATGNEFIGRVERFCKFDVLKQP